VDLKNPDELMAPLGVERFRREVLGCEHRLFDGAADRFEGLFGWASLNEILAAHRLDATRLQLLHDGRLIPEVEYTELVMNRKNRQWRRVRPSSVTGLLHDGATLQLREVESMCAPVRELIAACERELREPVTATAYAVVGDQPGAGLHWDDHDVLVVQISGAKRWSLYGQHEPKPLAGDLGGIGCPFTEPQAEYVLQPGQALYLPRGWWHLVRASNGPSLHLTMGIIRGTGADLLDWLARRLRSHDLIRADLPRWSDQADQREYLAKFCEVVRTALDDPELLERLWADRDSSGEVDPDYLLPFTAQDPSVPPQHGAMPLQMTTHRSVLHHDGRMR
jgi:Cupin superfamily protein